MRRSVVGVGLAVVMFLGAVPAASATEDPVGCSVSGLNLQFAPSSGLGTIHRNGDHLDIGLRVSNNAANACTFANTTINVQLPAPDGSPTGPLVNVVTGANFPGGMAQTTLATTVPYDVNLNPAVFSAPITASYSGTWRGPGGDLVLPGSLGTNVVISKPHITLTVTPNAPSGPAPFGVTYTYAATNDTPTQPPISAPTPALLSATSDTNIISDDTCSSLVFTGGDTHVTSPPELEQGETWTFTCTHLFSDPGTFTNTASIRSDSFSIRDGRPWPATTAQSTVTALGPDMTAAKTHSGDFTAGDTGRAYTLTAINSGNQTTSGTVTLHDSLPTGLTGTAISGTGWTCVLATFTCTRSDPIAGGTSYPPVTVTVDVASDAPGQVTNVATASGGGEITTTNDSASDPTTIQRPIQPPPPPSNAFTFGAVKGNADGSVTVVVNVPGSGSLSADDASAEFSARRAKKPSNLVKRITATAKGPGKVKLRFRLTKSAKRRLSHKSSLQAKVKVSYTPTGGSSASHTKTLRFKAPKKK